MGLPIASDARALTGLRFVERGTAALWLAPDGMVASDDGASAIERGRREGTRARFAATARRSLSTCRSPAGLTMLTFRDALRELAAAGLVTNDSAEALREVISFRPLLPGNRRDDPTRRAGCLRISRRRQDGRSFSGVRICVVFRNGGVRICLAVVTGGSDAGHSLGPRASSVPSRDDETRAEAIARQWLDRYGIVTRDWWRRERPAVSWRAIYRELRRLELRGEVRRGYFVRGLAGAQFATAGAVDALREVADDTTAPAITMSASDPANAYALPLQVSDEDRPALARPRGGGALLVTRRGRVIIAAEGRGRRLAIAPDAGDEDVRLGVESLVAHLMLPAPGALTSRPRDRDHRRRCRDEKRARRGLRGGGIPSRGPNAAEGSGLRGQVGRKPNGGPAQVAVTARLTANQVPGLGDDGKSRTTHMTTVVYTLA